jgi:hypothetical protein
MSSTNIPLDRVKPEGVTPQRTDLGYLCSGLSKEQHEAALASHKSRPAHELELDPREPGSVWATWSKEAALYRNRLAEEAKRQPVKEQAE